MIPNITTIPTNDKKSFRVIIAGGRDFNDYQLLKNVCDEFLSDKYSITIISGTARGADVLGEKYAREKNLGLDKYPADWSLGKHAGYLRNETMAKNADGLIAFWNGKSKGTKHMIDLSTKYNLIKKIQFYENGK